MRIHNLYTDANGQSHFRDIEVEWVEETRGGKLSKRLPATGIIFREVPPTYDLDWHPAPRRQYIINLDAGVQITASDGESRKIGAWRPQLKRCLSRPLHRRPVFLCLRIGRRRPAWRPPSKAAIASPANGTIAPASPMPPISSASRAMARATTRTRR